MCGSWDGYVRHMSYCRMQRVIVGMAMSDISPIVGLKRVVVGMAMSDTSPIVGRNVW